MQKQEQPILPPGGAVPPVQVQDELKITPKAIVLNSLLGCCELPGTPLPASWRVLIQGVAVCIEKGFTVEPARKLMRMLEKAGLYAEPKPAKDDGKQVSNKKARKEKKKKRKKR